jgi:molybdate transport system substrate-binding protein
MHIRILTMAAAIVSGLACAVGTGGYAQAESLTVGAPPSLRITLEEILPIFESEYGASVHVVYSPSKTLRRQIENGGAIDVFLAAGVDEVGYLHQKGLTRNGAPRIYAQTSLVLVMAMASPAMSVSFRKALPDRAIRIALGDPQTSSLGDVTAQALTKLDPAYRNRARLIHAQDSDAIVNLVRTGTADVGLVYRVDAINGGQVRISDEIPTGTFAPVQFSQAVVWTCRESARDIANEFSDFLMSPRIQKLMQKYGFDSLPSTNG